MSAAKYSVNMSELANSNLRSIYKYIAFTLCSKQSADRQVKRLKKAILSLDMFPARYRLDMSKVSIQLEIHIMPVDNYNVYYEIDEITQSVYVLAILYSKQDFTQFAETYFVHEH